MRSFSRKQTPRNSRHPSARFVSAARSTRPALPAPRQDFQLTVRERLPQVAVIHGPNVAPESCGFTLDTWRVQSEPKSRAVLRKTLLSSPLRRENGPALRVMIQGKLSYLRVMTPAMQTRTPTFQGCSKKHTAHFKAAKSVATLRVYRTLCAPKLAGAKLALPFSHVHLIPSNESQL